MRTAEELLCLDIDAVPRYLLLRDVAKLDKEDQELKAAKTRALQTKWIDPIVNLQWDDGSWGQFHSMSRSSPSVMTTEQALRRLLVLGLDREDPPIQKALRYMEKYLRGELELRDRREKKHDWDLLTRLFVATWILMIDPAHEPARRIAGDWSKIIIHAFSGGEYDPDAYKEAYLAVHRSSPEKFMWGFQNFYLAAILPGFLPEDVESKFLDYLISSDRGIYYIYEHPLNRLPDQFPSRQASGYMSAYELLSRYPSSMAKSARFVHWIHENVSGDGFWDMGAAVKDGVHYPLSDSWKSALSRKIDCTVRIQRLLSNSFFEE